MFYFYIFILFGLFLFINFCFVSFVFNFYFLFYLSLEITFFEALKWIIKCLEPELIKIIESEVTKLESFAYGILMQA